VTIILGNSANRECRHRLAGRAETLGGAAEMSKMSGNLISLAVEATSPLHRVDYPLGGTITASPPGLTNEIHFYMFSRPSDISHRHVKEYKRKRRGNRFV